MKIIAIILLTALASGANYYFIAVGFMDWYTPKRYNDPSILFPVAMATLFWPVILPCLAAIFAVNRILKKREDSI